MIKEEELDLLLKSLIGTRLEIRVESSYTTCILKFKLSKIMFSSGAHRSKVSDAMIPNNDVSLCDENYDTHFCFEYKDIESVVKDNMCKLHLIYRDGTNVIIYKEGNLK